MIISSTKITLLLLFSSSLLSASLGVEYRINTVDELISFSDTVNSKTNFSGTTVFLDSDIDFSGGYSKRFVPIGNSGNNEFLGVFDGQGHTISNLKIDSSYYQSTGLFGYSDGSTIQNVVIDDSCSIASSFTSTSYSSFVGGLFGGYYSGIRLCTIENSVNMADVTFKGNTLSDVFIGGIIGSLFQSIYPSVIKNCVNYGSLTHSGTGNSWVLLGGIAGISQVAGTSYNYIQNCLNYGKLIHSGTSNALAVGGIAGYSRYTVFDNCVNSGEISTNKESDYIGSIAGYISTYTEITHCFWEEDIKYNIIGYIDSAAVILNNHFFNPSSLELDEPVIIGDRDCTSLVDALNAAADYYTLREYSHWLLNKDSNAVSFAVNGMKQNFTLSSRIILLPSLASSGSIAFDRWYKDSGYSAPLTDYNVTVMSDMIIYGKTEENTNSYTITFDTRGGTPISSITEKFRSIVTLPSEIARGYCEFLGWKNEYGDYVPKEFTIPAHNIILHASWLCTRITTPEELISFSNAVIDGTSFLGTTVFLDSDIDFSGGYSEKFTPIGISSDSEFVGVFDGQGHIISNLKMKSSYQLTGLFGFSSGLAIQNVVIDYSCLFVNSYKSTSYNPFVGGIIGRCDSTTRPCTIENSVNMANVTFNEKSAKNIFIGGIIGSLYQSIYPNVIKNCANYGSVTHFGTSSSWVEIGGIAGISEGAESSYNYIQNCLNYGMLIHNGTSKSLAIGGIVGVSWYTIFDNCVNSGEISTNKASSYVGNVVGKISAYTEVTHCYWNENIRYDVAGYVGSTATLTNNHIFNPSSFELDESVTIGSRECSSLIDVLNVVADYYTLRDYSHWLLNKDRNTVSFAVNGMKQNFTLSSRIILLPSLASSGSNVFDGWYKDSDYLTRLIDYTAVGSDMTLYGKTEENTNTYTIIFDTKGGTSVNSITGQFGTVVTLPSETTRDRYEFTGWETSYGDSVSNEFTIPVHNIILYATWLCTRITTLEELISFSKAVNSGTNFFGTTVFLDSDIDFGGVTFSIIGETQTNYFQGTFDGQGYVIRNLKMRSYSSGVGLFGYSYGMTIRNVVMDDSCSITSSYKGNTDNMYVGSMIGLCEATSSECIIENSINMADVSFDGDFSGRFFYLGGITGEVIAKSRSDHIINCANYGSVRYLGNGTFVSIGGIIGEYGNSTNKYFQNCINYGSIIQSGTVSNKLSLGGLIGNAYAMEINNCVNAGKLSYSSSSSKSSYLANIVGVVYATGTITISYSYWASDTGCDLIYGIFENKGPTISNCHSYNSTTFELSQTVSVNGHSEGSLVHALNGIADESYSNDYSHWLLNKDRRTISSTLNKTRKLSFTLDSQVILLPNLANEGNITFNGWYSDENLTVPFLEGEVSSDTTLYGMFYAFCYTVTLNVNGGNASSLSAMIMVIIWNETYGTFQAPTRIGHTFRGWYTEEDGGNKVETGDKVTIMGDHTLYAHWTINNHTLTFIFNNGKTTPKTSTLNFNETIKYPDNVTRNGCTFIGWDNNITNMPDNDLTITARWSKGGKEVGPPKEGKDNYTELILILITLFVIVIIAILITVTVIFLKRKNNSDNKRMAEIREFLIRKDGFDDSYSRVVVMADYDAVGTNIINNTVNTLDTLYPSDYKKPTMKEALTTAEFTEEKAELICNVSENIASKVMLEDKLFEEFTKEDVAAIAMYTYDFGPGDFESNPFRIINKSLAERSTITIQRASGLLYLVMTALRKLPRITGITLYRGVRGQVNMDKEHYYKGNIVTWMALSSTSPDMDATKAFLAKGSQSGISAGTLFIIEDGWGYDIQPYSMFPDEEEILLEPERQFRVKSVIRTEGMTIINLKMLDTPLALPNVFGEGRG